MYVTLNKIKMFPGVYNIGLNENFLQNPVIDIKISFFLQKSTPFPNTHYKLKYSLSIQTLSYGKCMFKI